MVRSKQFLLLLHTGYILYRDGAEKMVSHVRVGCLHFFICYFHESTVYTVRRTCTLRHGVVALSSSNLTSWLVFAVSRTVCVCECCFIPIGFWVLFFSRFDIPMCAWLLCVCLAVQAISKCVAHSFFFIWLTASSYYKEMVCWAMSIEHGWKMYTEF